MTSISIAMATYNGARFIAEQLRSIANQTIKPDELVITDDGSTDDTLRIIGTFAQNAPFKVHIERNQYNLGYPQNFAKALALCSGDIIFLSDQDDAWLPNKIAKVVGVFQKDFRTQLVLNDMIICDQNLEPSEFTQLSNILSAGRRADAFYSGCCMAIRKEFLGLVLPLPATLFAHDNWVNHLSLALDVRSLISEPLQKYRRHDANASNWEMSDICGTSQLKVMRRTGLKPSIKGWCDQVARYEQTMMRIKSKQAELEALGLGNSYCKALEHLTCRIQNLEDRIQIFSRPRPLRWVEIILLLKRGCYSDFSGWKSAVKDAVS